MKKQLLAIAPVDLPKYWPEIRDEVATIEIPDGFIAEDAYSMCRQNAATLFYLMVDHKRVGWMICRLVAPDLHIWMLKAETGYDVMHQFRDELMGMARTANARSLTYGSTRKAWAKVAPDHGFKIRMVVYECPVDPDPNSLPTMVSEDLDSDQHATH